MNMLRKSILYTVIVLALVSFSAAQEQRSEIAVQGTGFFTKDSIGGGVTQRATETGGFLVSYRYWFTRWIGAQADYGYDRNTQQFLSGSTFSRVQANIHQATGGFVVGIPHPISLRISPYVLAEGGALVFDPTGNLGGSVAGTSSQSRGTFVYGGGANVPLTKHFSLRAEYRGLVYNGPDFGLRSLRTDTWTHVAQPSAGIVVRF
jgi:opacity protein-like surface antigen